MSVCATAESVQRRSVTRSAVVLHSCTQRLHLQHAHISAPLCCAWPLLSVG